MNEQRNKSYLAIPPSGKGPGVVVLHAWWGLNEFMRSVCDRLAQAGFVALAPDMFLGEMARTIEEAKDHLSKFDQEHLVPPIVLSALKELSANPAVNGNGFGVIGFSLGAYWALWLAQQKPESIRAVTVFYGTDGGDGDFHQSRAAFLGHFAALDPYEPEAGIRELEKSLRSAKRPTTFYNYPGIGHWFFEQDRPDAYDAQAAQLAWDGTIVFMRKELDGGSG